MYIYIYTYIYVYVYMYIQRDLPHSWIIVVIVMQRLVQIGRVDGPTELDLVQDPKLVWRLGTKLGIIFARCNFRRVGRFYLAQCINFML